MAIKPIEEMIRPVSRGDDVLEKLRANDPDKELRDKGILSPLQKMEGIMQVTSASGNDKILSAMMWAATLPEFGSLEAVLDSLDAGETDINGLVNAYEDAIVDMN